VQLLPGRLKGLTDVAFSGDGRFVAACGADGLVAWDLSRPEAAAVQFASPGTAYLQPLPGRGFFANPPEGLFVYDPAAGTSRPLGLRGGYTGHIHSPRTSPDGKRVVVCGSSSKLRLYDLKKDKAELRWARPHRPRDFPRAEFLPSGDRLLVLECGAYQAWPVWGYPLWFVVRDVATGEKITGMWYASVALRKMPDQFVLSHDGSALVMGFGATFEVWDTTNMERPLREVKPGRCQILGMAFHPSADVLATVGNDPVVRFWDARTWKESRTLTWGLGKLKSVAFSPDGTRAAVGAVNGRVLVWDVDL
jgi:WD40 repeat protein